MITQQQLLDTMTYDGQNLIWVKPTARAVKPGQLVGCVNKLGYRSCNIGGKGYYVHRLIWLYIYGIFPTKFLDHIDGNPANNAITNLRECDYHENFQNLKRKPNKSGYTGVDWHPSGKWRARIRAYGEYHMLGLFDNPAEAGQAYLDAKANLHTFNPTQR